MTLDDLRPALLQLMETTERSDEALALLQEFRQHLNSGDIRAARRTEDGGWEADPWVKAGLLLHSMIGNLENRSEGRNWEMDTLPPRRFLAGEMVRAPEGCRIRDGSYWGIGSICMPPSFISLGAYIGAGTSIDSNSSVGLCAQIGANVVISAGTQIGGVIAPLDRLPVVIEDGAFLAQHTSIFGSVIVGEGAVVGGGVMLSDAFPVWDLRVKQPVPPGPNGVLVIPPRCVILNLGLSTSTGIVVQTPVIAGVRERDEPPMSAIRRALLSL